MVVKKSYVLMVILVCMTSVIQSSQKHTLNFVTAYHEAAHSVVAVLLAERNKRFFLYDTVVFLDASSNQSSSGETRILPMRSEGLSPQENIESLLCTIIVWMAGRAAEEMLFNEFGGCSADYSLARHHARELECYVKDYNFVFCFEDLIKDFIGEESSINIRKGMISDEIIDCCLQVSRQLLDQNKELLERVAPVLLDGKRLRAQEVKNILVL